MSKIFIEKRLCIDSYLLNENIKEHILDKLKKEYVGKCDKEYGFIVKIYDKIEILDNIVSPSSHGVFFLLKFCASVYKPEVNKKYKGKVCLVFSNGIFVELFEKIKVLVPQDKMSDYKYNKLENKWKREENTQKNTQEITIGSNVDVEIKMIKYEKQNFSCIGKLL
jgi:DNA-directed RNA polymerase subunit E'/Rpb7